MVKSLLSAVNLEPAAHQVAWCERYAAREPEVAMRSLGSELGIEDSCESQTDDADEDEETIHAEDHWDWPCDVDEPIDYGYRVALSVILRPVLDNLERTRLLHMFFDSYIDYVVK